MKPLLHRMLALVIVWVAIPACSDENDQPDGAVDAGQDAGEDAGADPGADPGSDPAPDGTGPLDGAGTDAGWDAGTFPDYDPQSSFLLTIPPGTGLNTVFCEGRTWQDEYQMQGRIDLVPGVYVLPRTEAPLYVDLIESVFFGPEHIPAQATGPGHFDVENRYDSWYYFYRQDFLLANEPYHLDVTILFSSFYWEPDWPAQVVMEGEFAATHVHAGSRLGAGTGWCEERQGFSFYDLSSMSGADHLATTAGGDRVLVEVRHARACLVAGNTGCDETNHAELSLDGVQRVITDPGALFYSAGHHNLEQKYLLLLDEPIGNTVAVLVEAPIMGQTEGGSLVKLDDSMSPVGSEPFVDWQTTWR